MLNLSKLSLLVTLLTTLFFGLSFHRWDDDWLIVADAVDYYLYLPAGIIYNDLSLEFKNELSEELVKKKIKYQPSPSGKNVIKMTMGIAILTSPFFIAGHLIASFSEVYENNGFSAPYYFMSFISALFWLWVGLFFLRKFLIQYFNDISVAVVLILVVLATNLLFYTSIEPGMAHVYSFAFISMFIYFSFKWLSNPDYKTSIISGLLLGFIILLRPSNILIVLLPLMFFIFDGSNFKSKVAFIQKHFLKLLLAAFFMMIVLLPQLIYWKTFTGRWFYYSYTVERFFFNNPHIIKGLFSYRKGWLLYTPIMFFAIIGLINLWKTQRQFVFPILIFSLLNMYVIYSWWNWWYGGSYSSRPMIDSYAVYAIPMAAFVQYLFQKKIWKRILIGGVFCFFIYFNTFQIRQYSIGLLHYSNMTKEAYWAILFKMRYPENYDELIQATDQKSALEGKEEQLDNKPE